jgi:hypothetical protein
VALDSESPNFEQNVRYIGQESQGGQSRFVREADSEGRRGGRRPMGALAGPAASPAPAGRPPALATSGFGPGRGAGPAGAQAAAAAPWPRRGCGKGSAAARPPARRAEVLAGAALSGGGISVPLDEAGQLALTRLAHSVAQPARGPARRPLPEP